MKIIIDAMGGDRAPEEIVKAVAEASGIVDADLVVTGDENEIKKYLSQFGADLSRIEIVPTETVITMEDDPLSAVKTKKDSSMSEGLRLLRDGGDAFVSAGNTGALFVGSSLIVRNVKGIKRAAIATVLPFARPVLLLDSGANVTALPEYLAQWAVLGSVYVENVMGIASPEVGLLNNGVEEHKGTPELVEAYGMLKETDSVRFIGNVEARDVPYGPCDVLVTDGFTGNVTLKLAEGVSTFLLKTLKETLTDGMLTKLCALPMKGKLRGLKSRFDASEYGGAPILGIRKPVIKAHGSSDARAFLNAVKQAEKFARSGFSERIADMADLTGEGKGPEKEEEKDDR